MHTPRHDPAASSRARPWRSLALATLAALVLSACGGDLAESVLEEALEREHGGDVDIDFDGDGGFSASVDGADVEFGTGDRPDWLPGWWELPEDLEITWQYQDSAEGGAAVAGWLPDGTDAAELVAATRQMVEDAGYVVSNDFDTNNSLGFNARHPDGDGIEFGVTGLLADTGELQYGVGFSEDVGFDPLEDAEVTSGGDASSGPSTGAGESFGAGSTMMLRVAGDTVNRAGFCVVDGTYGQFTADDGYATLIMDSSLPLATGGVSQDAVDGGWFMDPNAGPFTVIVGDDGFSYEGRFKSVDGSKQENGTVEVSC